MKYNSNNCIFIYRVFLLLFIVILWHNSSAQEIRSVDCTVSHFETVSSHDYNDFEHGDWILIFEDNFDGGVLDTVKWYTCEDGWNRFHGDCGNELQCYLDENIIVDNGILKLVAKEETTGILRPECNILLPYSSGWIQTKTKFKYGLIEARCKVPFGKGFWPAFWLFGHNAEIDIFEIYGNEDSTVHTDMHRWNEGQSAHCPDMHDKNGLYSDFHIYRIEWDEFKITYSIDGSIIRTQYKYTDLLGRIITDRFTYANSSNYLCALNIYPDSLQSIILNLAISNSTAHPGPDNNTVFPSHLDVDYVRVYKRNNKDKDWTISSYNSDSINYLTGRNIFFSNDSGNVIHNGNYLDCLATQEIILRPDFFAEFGSEFQATIVPISKKDLKQDDSYGEKMASDFFQDNNGEDVLLQIFPNPSSGLFTFLFTDETTKIMDIFVEDGKGSPILIKTGINKSQYNIKLEIPGVYYARIRTEKYTFLKKLIVKSQ